MKLEDFYNSIKESFPPIRNCNEDVVALIERLRDDFVVSAEKIEDGNWIVNNQWVTIKSIEDFCNELLDCVKFIHTGNHAQAYSHIEKALNGKNYCFIDIHKGERFYRIRRRRDCEHFERNDMFHIPSKERYKVQTQRYSSIGVPCLYLSKSIIGCWEELHRPPLNECMVSQFEAQEDFKVLSLWLPPFEQLKGEKIRWLHLIPLIWLCMIQVQDYNHSFKDEYVIPQLIMEWLLSSETAKEHNVRGISYLSVHWNQDFGYSRDAFQSLAIPSSMPLNKKGMTPLKELFLLTNPTSDDIERIYGGSRSSHLRNNNNRNRTLFDEMEMALSDRARFPLGQANVE